MKARRNLIPVVVPVLVGVIFGHLFLSLNDADRVAARTVQQFGWFAVFPSALLLALWSRSLAWLIAPALLAGIFVGVCVRILFPTVQSNIWPIAGVYWALRFFIPVVAGTLLGAIGGRWLRSAAGSRDPSADSRNEDPPAA